MSTNPLITIAVPSYNQGRYLEQALRSISEQSLPIELMIMDGGSTDETANILHRWGPFVRFWRSHPDSGQAAAINEGIQMGEAPYVAWLNSDDWLLPDGLLHLVNALEKNPSAPAAYGNAFNFIEKKQSMHPIWVESFNEKRLALRCIISQPATLIRRQAWENVGGLNTQLHMAMDYDLWWRLFKKEGPLMWVDKPIAVNRDHCETKTNTKRRLHYQEAMQVVHTHYGRLPLKWWLYQPYAVWYKTYISTSA